MNTENEYVKQLESTISKFMQPLRGIPFPIAIKALTGCRVLPFEPSVDPNKKYLELLSRGSAIAGSKANREGIFCARPNEAGIHIEPFVREAFIQVGLEATRPIAKSGKKKSSGYPDIQVDYKDGNTVYLDCKTYNTKSTRQSFRTFYFSPSEDPKITKDAFHMVLSYELMVGDRQGKRAFIPIAWQLYSLEKLLIQIKHEFNASNRQMYRPDLLLAKGIIP